MASSIQELVARVRARQAVIDAFVRDNRDRPFFVPSRGGAGIVVSRDPADRRWRTTRLDTDGPVGHHFHASYAAAVKSAVVDLGADLERAQFRG